jgi:hypothetical protein
MNSAAYATQDTSSPEPNSGPSIVEKNMEEPPVLGKPEASAKPKLTLLDKSV